MPEIAFPAALFYAGLMHCVVTAGPTCEPLDAVRRLTNFSTGRLGSELATFLAARGHEVTLLLGQQATWRGERRAHHLQTFVTAAELREQLRALAGRPVEAVFHAAAVSDFSFGKIWRRTARGELAEIKAGKLSSRQGTLLAELVPAPKLIAELRDWFPGARLVGWKYEVDGAQADVVRLAREQMAACRTDACVANGPAYGLGFGLVTGARQCTHWAEPAGLFGALAAFICGAERAEGRGSG